MKRASSRRHYLCPLTTLCSTSLALEFDKDKGKQTDIACFPDHYWLTVSLDLLDRHICERLRFRVMKILNRSKHENEA